MNGIKFRYARQIIMNMDLSKYLPDSPKNDIVSIDNHRNTLFSDEYTIKKNKKTNDAKLITIFFDILPKKHKLQTYNYFGKQSNMIVSHEAKLLKDLLFENNFNPELPYRDMIQALMYFKEL